MKNPNVLLNACGMLILPWLIGGIAIAIALNSDFNFPHDVLSQLGASGSKTEYISPIINNYPVGVLFIIFGLRITYLFSNSKSGLLSGIFIMLHGLGSVMAGLFSCDPGCPIFNGSLEQIVHTISGVSMFATLTISALLWFQIGHSDPKYLRLGSISLASAIISSVFLLLALIGHIIGGYAGLFESLSYGVLCAWCFLVSFRLSIGS